MPNDDLAALSRSDLEAELIRLRGALEDQSKLAGSAARAALFEAIDDGFCIIEFIDGPHGPLSDYVHIEANSGYERHTGIRGIIGMRLREVAPNDADGWLTLYGGVLNSGVPIRFERQFVEAGRHIEVSASRVGDPSLRQVSVLFRDVTARKEADAALKASEALARENIQRVQLALSAGAIIGTWFWDIPADKFSVDDAFARAFGLELSADGFGPTMQQIVETVHPDDKAGLIEAVEKALHQGGAYAHQYRTRRADGGYYWLEANGRVEMGSDGKAKSFPGVILDIDQRRSIEAERDRVTKELRALNETLEQRVSERTSELMRTEEQLRHAQKMEAVGQLTGGIAHDFNNLLAGISGSIEIMQSRLAQGRISELAQYLTGAQGAAARAARLTQRLLAFSRRQTLDPKPSDVNRLVSGMQDLITRSVGPSIDVETILVGGLWTAFVDVGQLENALLNLCINARDAMPGGGKLTIETANRWLDQRGAEQRGLEPGQYISLCVSDTGSGMSAEIIERAFDPFFTTKASGEGTGLGLSMVHGFAGQSGGTVRIYSELGKGTMVCIYLPRHLGAAETIEEEKRPAQPIAADQSLLVLVVDDEPLVRMITVDILEDHGYAVVEAGDAASALRIIEKTPTLNLLLTDVGLPGGMNGRELAQAARGLRPDLNTLFVTGYAENAVLNHGHLEHGMQVLSKPFLAEDLMQRVRQLTDKASS